MMNLSNSNFIFEGFEPSNDVKIYCKGVYCLVEDQAPSKSTKTAYISKINNEYEGTIKIVYTKGTFKVQSKNIALKSLIDELYKKMSLKILDWSETRDY